MVGPVTPRAMVPSSEFSITDVEVPPHGSVGAGQFHSEEWNPCILDEPG